MFSKSYNPNDNLACPVMCGTLFSVSTERIILDRDKIYKLSL